MDIVLLKWHGHHFDVKFRPILLSLVFPAILLYKRLNTTAAVNGPGEGERNLIYKVPMQVGAAEAGQASSDGEVVPVHWGDAVVRALQGGATVLLIAVASLIVSNALFPAADFGFDSTVSNGIDDWGPADVRCLVFLRMSRYLN